MPVGVGLYDRDYMRWTPEERRRYLSGASSPAVPVNARPALVVAAVAVLVFSLLAAKLGLGLPALSKQPAAPTHSGPIGCIGPSTIPCPPGSVRVRDPQDPNNPRLWPNDLHAPRANPRV